ncbi:D-aminoacyl-tRNA deacylase isoform X6 [Calliopsis andreniformis]
MKAIIQRVTKASVSVDGDIISSIGNGLCVLVGIKKDDSLEDMNYM